MHTVWMSTSSSVRKWVLKFSFYTWYLASLSASNIWRLLLNPLFVSLGGLPEEWCVRGHCGPLPEGQQAGGRGLQQPRDCYGQAHPEHLWKQITGILLLNCFLIFCRELFVMLYLTPCVMQAHVRDKLDETRQSDVEQYLKNLYDLYTRYLSCSQFLIHFLSAQ